MSSGSGLGQNFFKSFTSTSSGGGGFLGSMLRKALEMCSTSHAWDIARQEGIDMRDIKFNFKEDGGVEVLVDAPHATPLQIEQLGKRVEKECPMGMMRKAMTKKNPNQQMKWMRLPDRYDR